MLLRVEDDLERAIRSATRSDAAKRRRPRPAW